MQYVPARLACRCAQSCTSNRTCSSSVMDSVRQRPWSNVSRSLFNPLPPSGSIRFALAVSESRIPKRSAKMNLPQTKSWPRQENDRPAISDYTCGSILMVDEIIPWYMVDCDAGWIDCWVFERRVWQINGCGTLHLETKSN